MRTYSRGHFNTTVIPEEPGNTYWFHADKSDSAIHYYVIDHALQSKLPLGSVSLENLSIDQESKDVISKVQEINEYVGNPGSAEFRNALTGAKTAGLNFARRILSLDALECLLRCLATPNSTVVFVPAHDLRGIPWELCYLRSTEPLPTEADEPDKSPVPAASFKQIATEVNSSAPSQAPPQHPDKSPMLEGFVNEIGSRFSRIMATVKLLPTLQDRSGRSMLIVDEVLESTPAHRKLIHDVLNAQNIDHIHILIKDELKGLSSQRNAVVYMGHQDTEKGLRLSTEVFFDKNDLGLFPFAPDGICVLAMCSTYEIVADSFAANVADECGCNVVYSLVELPISVGLEIASTCHKEMCKLDGTAFWKVWRRVQEHLSPECRPYSWFFAMHGRWLSPIPEKEE